jgi:hypothetical protein
MKPILLMLGAALCLAACNETGKTATAPAAPKSVAEVTAAIKGKTYKVENLGLLSPFASDTANPVNWKVQQEDTSKFFRDYVAKQNQFTLSISADSSASFFDAANNKTVKGIFTVDDAITEGYSEKEKPGIKLRLQYNDSLDFGGKKTASVMTQSYLVKGISANELVVETGQSFNRRTLVLWLKAGQ